MYTVTFYSFKGGVGRTMAMANVGLALARAGRRVLLVDFDLEAPGLDTFSLLKPIKPTSGIVDYVTEYVETGVAPDATKFLYQPSHLDLNATLWVMPTGRQDEHYGNRLNAIDWQQLYAERDGYLLFEDLKQQWERELRPDYVFIDSRTGHTDVGGICTRQLPDAVALLFFPNEQNRRGLELVVRDIRRESQDSGRRIRLHFVAANVPDLDDEDSIVRERLREFQRTLHWTQLDATIHHYDSLGLLQQTVFTIERPRTKLAREYDKLGKQLRIGNLWDREVVLEFLDGVPHRFTDPYEIDERLRETRDLYSNDGEVLYALSQANQALGREDAADQLLSEAREHGFLSEDELIERASQDYSSGSFESARKYIHRALDLNKLSRVFTFERLLSVVVANDVGSLGQVLSTLEARGISSKQRLFVTGRLMVRRDALPALEDFLRPLTVSDEESQFAARRQMSLCFIGERRYDDAKAVIALNAPSLGELAISDAFNYAMADWGATETIPKDQFLRVVALGAEYVSPGPNVLQCLAIANWAVGRIEAARECVNKSRGAMDEVEFEFSGWRYLRVAREVFLRDLDSLEAMIDSGSGQPLILCEHD
jgi:MinD-like ATPase involved in chromosome partitioning or flagellar assembly